MTIGTAPLTPEATWQEIHALVIFLAEQGIDQVAITYGWGCTAGDVQQPIVVPLAALVGFLHKSIAQGIYHLGEDNLYIESGDPYIKITLCHEADIHFEAANTVLEARQRAAWESRGLRAWTG